MSSCCKVMSIIHQIPAECHYRNGIQSEHGVIFHSCSVLRQRADKNWYECPRLIGKRHLDGLFGVYREKHLVISSFSDAGTVPRSLFQCVLPLRVVKWWPPTCERTCVGFWPRDGRLRLKVCGSSVLIPQMSPTEFGQF